MPVFVDATAVAGLSHAYEGGEAYVVGGGAAAFDCDGDLLPELAIAGAEQPLTLWRNTGRPGRPPSFERAEGPLVEPVLATTGVYPLDFDGDGVLDLFVLRFGRNLAMRGLGNCRFEDATDALALPQAKDWTTAFAATWEDGADLPTLFVGNYVPRDRPLQERENCEPSYILRPQGGVYGRPVSLGKGACTLSALFLDWSGTGRIDLRLANDREYYDRGQSEQLFRLTEDGVAEYGRDDGWDDVSLWGMGLAAEDITGDPRPEIVVTSMADNRMEHLREGDAPAFENIARELGTTAQRPPVGPDVRPSTAWHTEFGDANNDGWSDLLIIKGNVDEMPRMAGFDPDSLLLGGEDGFREVGYEAGIAVDTKGRGAVFQDINGDGALDLLTINRNQPVRLFAGRPMANFVTVDLRQDGPNAFAVGASVEMRLGDRILHKSRRVGGGHAGGALLPLHFGMGGADTAEVRAIWPDGTAGDWQSVEAGKSVTLTRP
ncbi:CRTAC1 family protein [Algicella marina]|uniref:CRTAC1 family protein n=1 Tax=Algicella marina TaxID=2683284 RepID=UPI0024DFFD65|nr:CRTAC1 family protein [Algicella marina]